MGEGVLRGGEGDGERKRGEGATDGREEDKEGEQEEREGDHGRRGEGPSGPGPRRLDLELDKAKVRFMTWPHRCHARTHTVTRCHTLLLDLESLWF